ncbi:fibronectin type III domain-containing protein 7-like [Scleropages formosus]|uniref:fibronectin type III domain-containing protein 7-like n=1 Tax=Scleropages formosus TaxID=113540 RepID=UPI0010FA79D6|nr:fibronectin type III domain-containing protein 7-like [Scleropages formosus]
MNSITCNTTTPSCVFANLDCKMSFAFTVTAYSKQCESEPSKPVEITTEPCQPQSVTVKHACNNDTITVQWQNVRRADYYMVTVNGDLGYVVESETPHMILETMILCGQSYTISVRGWDNNTCDGPSSDPTVQVYTQCENNMDAVVWGESEGAESYTAMAVGRHGHIHTCNTTETNCTWDNLHCSDSYTINIVAVDSQCHSLPSNNSTIYTAPCPPHGLKATLNCSNKVVSLSWDASEMTTFYTAAMYNGSQKIVELSTNETLAYFSEISCSQQYSFTVTAWRNEQCRSTPSSLTYLTTEPCSPSHVVPVIDCISSSASVTWAPVNKAMYYVATFQSEDGQSQNCSSPRTACSLPTLPCGRTYSVFVTAVNDQCNSIPSMPKILHTVPCVPESVSTMVDCMDNTALVSWNRSEGALSYRAIAKDSTGIMVSCEMPCIPEINSLYLDCFTNSLLLQWDYVHGATSYTALAESHNHVGTSCKSNDTNCEIEGLLCGQMYTVRLLASDEQCNSTPSTGQKIASVPCIPQNVKAQMNCSGNMAYVEWDDSSGAESYVVNAFGIGGYNSSCSSTNPACQVPDLLCGDTYNISVVAVSQDCNISESSAVELESGKL